MCDYGRKEYECEYEWSSVASSEVMKISSTGHLKTPLSEMHFELEFLLDLLVNVSYQLEDNCRHLKESSFLFRILRCLRRLQDYFDWREQK